MHPALNSKSVRVTYKREFKSVLYGYAIKLKNYQIHSVLHLLQTLIMAAAAHVDPSTEDISSALVMKIQSTNYYVEGENSQCPEEFKMLIVALQHSVLSKAMFNSFSVPVLWLCQEGSTVTYNKASDTITFHLINDKKVRLSQR